MIRFLTGLFILTFTNTVFSQNPVFFEQKGDTAILYLSCNGIVASKDKAYYKRVVLFEKKRLAFQGNVVDFYFPDGTIALKAQYSGGRYNGLMTTYFNNGKIRETGNYKNDNRDSIWTYYYDNGQIEKKINYYQSQPRLFEYHTKDGKPVFLDGNGLYKGHANNTSNSCSQYPIKGELKDGLMTGRWTIKLDFSVCTEVFEEGKFIRGLESPHNRVYESGSMIDPIGFPYYENMDILGSTLASNKKSIYWPIYDGKIIFANKFYNDLSKMISNNFNLNDFFYALIEFQIEDGIIKPGSIKAITSNNENFEKLRTLLLSMDKWEKSPDKVSYTIYLPVFWENGNIYLEPRDIAKFN